MAVKLDEVDIQLLNALQADADRTNVELARLVGLSPAATLHRVRYLKESGVIRIITADNVAGEMDYIFTVVARDVAELQEVLARLSTRGGQRLITYLRLSEVKPPCGLPLTREEPAAAPRPRQRRGPAASH